MLHVATLRSDAVGGDTLQSDGSHEIKGVEHVTTRPAARMIPMLLAVAAAAQVCRGQSTWSGGGTSNSWYDQQNWVPLGVPTSGADIVFAGSLRLTPDTGLFGPYVGSLTFDNTAGPFVIYGLGSTNVEDAIINNDADVQTFNSAITCASGVEIRAAVGPLTFNWPLFYGSALTVSGASDVTFNALGYAPPGLTLEKDGSGTLRVNAPIQNSPYDDASIVINEGTIRLGSHNVLPVGQLTCNGGTLDMNGYSDTLGASAGTGGTVHLPGSSALTLTLPVSGPDLTWPTQFTGDSTASVTFDKAANSFTDLILNQSSPFPGQYRLSNWAWVRIEGDDRLSNDADLEINGNAVLALGSSTQTVDQVVLQGLAITGDNGVGTLNANSFTVERGFISANLGGPGALTKTTSGQVQFYVPTAVYSGGTFVEDGELWVQIDGGLPVGGPVTVNSPGVLRFYFSSGPMTATIGLASGNGVIEVESNQDETAVLNTSGAGFWGPQIIGTGDFRKIGPGTLTVSGSDMRHTGGVVVADGILVQLGSIMDPTRLRVEGGTLAQNTFDCLTEQITLAGGQISGGDLWPLESLTLESGIVGSIIKGYIELIKTTPGTVSLTSENDYQNGARLLDGVLEVTNIRNLNINAHPLYFDGGTLRVLGMTATIRSITVEDGGGNLELFDTFDSRTSIDGAGTLTKSGPGRLYLYSGSTFSPGALNIAAGEVEVRTANASVPGAIAIAAGGLLHVGAGSLIAAAAITNSGEIDLDTGAQIIAPLTNDGQVTADGIFAGQVVNNAGGRIANTPGSDLTFSSPLLLSNAGEIVVVDGECDVASPVQNLSPGGRITLDGALMLLDGPLTNEGALAFAGGSSLVIGDVVSSGNVVVQSQAVANFFDDLTLSGPDSNLEIEIGGTTPGAGHGRLVGLNAIALPPSLTLRIVDGFVLAPGSAFTIITGNGVTGTFSDVTFIGFPQDLSATLEYAPTSVTLHIGDLPVADVDVGVIYTKIPGHPTAAVPGLRDLGGAPVASDFRTMTNLAVSPDGSRWMLSGSSQLGSSLENVLVLGSGATGSAFAQEGQPIPGGAPGELYDFFSTGLGRFNTQNHFAYAARARGGVASVFQKVIVWNGVTQTIAFQMGDSYYTLHDLPPNPSGDELVGNSVTSIHLLNSGIIGSYDATVQNINSSRRPVTTYDRDLHLQVDVISLTALGGIGSATWGAIESNSFYTTPDGMHWMAEGDVNAPPTNPRVLVRDGVAVLQENEPVAGSGLLLGDISQSVLLANGDWLARGRDNSGTGTTPPDWAVRNGVLIAMTGDPVFAGATIDWGDTLYAVAGNTAGDYLIAGRSTGPEASNDMLVLNGSQIILREGDPVDVDGNGSFDDNAFIGRGVNTLAFMATSLLHLTDSGVVYAVVHLRDAAGNDLNSNPISGLPTAFVRIALGAEPPTCPGDRGDANCDGTIDFFDIDPFLLSLFNPAAYTAANCGGSLCAADIDCNGGVDFFDIDPFLACLFSTCPPCP